jgi:putative ABC transport system substrate-binding protein
MDRRAFVNRIISSSLLLQPLLSIAQQSQKLFRVGFLLAGARLARSDDYQFDALAQGLRELGYIEGKNVVFERRWAGGSNERLAELATELVRLPVDVIVAQGPGGLHAAARATKTIPIVMVAGSGDPVGEGWAASLARPGGNVTGLAYAVSPERFGKELELLKAAAPHISRIAVSWDLEDQELYRRTVQPHLEAAARKLGLLIQSPVQITDAKSLDNAFATIREQRSDALIILIAGRSYEHRERLAALAIANHLPNVAAFRFIPEGGGLMSYGPDTADMWRRAASYLDKIIRGAKPGELPIELPRRDEFVINLRTAKALELTIPQSLLLRADKVIQ